MDSEQRNLFAMMAFTCLAIAAWILKLLAWIQRYGHHMKGR
jgi:hypothetical protein